MGHVLIYALCEPDTDTVRYIGAAHNPDVRLAAHMQESYQCSLLDGQPLHTTPKHAWIRALAAQQNRSPNLLILEECRGPDWRKAEQGWIDAYKSQGAQLLNIRKGGGGHAG